MAVRLINLHKQPLCVDLRGGDVLFLAAGQRSAALREELLYDNCHLPAWERSGWIARVPARMSEVLAGDAPVAVAAPRKRAVAATQAKPEPRKAPAAKKSGKKPGKKASPGKR